MAQRIIQLGLVLDGVYRTTAEGTPVYHAAPAQSNEQLRRLLDGIINRIIKLLTRQGHLVEEEGVTYLARTYDIDPDNLLAPLQAASCTYRIAMRAARGTQSAELAVRRT